ncbi:MAG: radical SAM protein [Clostridiales bacterium]
MKVNEIFSSIQGEGKYTGYPTVFVRFSGCNLRCQYCDTKYSYREGFEINIEDILKKIKLYGIKRVCITGGEPLLNDISFLLKRLKDYWVSIETNGSIDLGKYSLSKNHNFIMDIKTPSSGVSEFNLYENFKNLNDMDEIKFVISSKDDYIWAKEIINNYYIKGEIVFSTVFGKLRYEDVVKWILEDKIEARFQIQLHKIVWDVDKRGV